MDPDYLCVNLKMFILNEIWQFLYLIESLEFNIKKSFYYH